MAGPVKRTPLTAVAYVGMVTVGQVIIVLEELRLWDAERYRTPHTAPHTTNRA